MNKVYNIVDKIVLAWHSKSLVSIQEGMKEAMLVQFLGLIETCNITKVVEEV